MKRIESTQNALVKQWKKLVLTRKERDQSKEFIIEGFHLVEEALKADNSILVLIKREDVELPSHWNLEHVHIVEISMQVAKEIAETEHSQGVFAHCRQPDVNENGMGEWKKYLLIDSVQDPGNVGTMIRTADAAGIDAIILGTGSADPYNPKTVRAAQGSHFNIPILKGDLIEWVQRLKSEGIRLLGTGLDNSVDHTSISPVTSFALIVGNEGSGVSEELLLLADETVRIPIYGKAESLNVAVATGILLYTYTN